MIAIDTNILIRLLVGDDAVQSEASQKLFAAEDIFIADTVLLETEWVLRGVFDRTRAEVCSALRGICGLCNVTLADGQRVAQVIDWHEAGFDFADAFHLALSQNQDAFKTFDGDFVRNARKLTVLRVEQP